MTDIAEHNLHATLPSVIQPIEKHPRPANDEFYLPMILHTRVVTGTGGGPEKTILNSGRFLSRLGYNSICAYLKPPHDPGFSIVQQRAAIAQADLWGIDDHGPLDWSIVSKSREICRQKKVAIWHAHDYKTNLLGLLVRRWWPMKLVTTVHGWVEATLKMRAYNWCDRLTLRHYDRVIAVSEELFDKCLAFGVLPERLQLIKNGIDTETYSRQKTQAQAKSELGLDPTKLLVGAMGRLSHEKGFDNLIRSFQHVIDKGFKAQLVIVGEGKLKETLQNQIDLLNLSDHVTLVGFQPNPADWFEAMDTFVLSSRFEGLPNVVLEAMSLRTPVVATRIPAIESLIIDRESGLLCDVECTDSLGQTIVKMLSGAHQRQKFATAARTQIEKDFSFRNRMTKIGELYSQLELGPSTQP